MLEQAGAHKGVSESEVRSDEMWMTSTQTPPLLPAPLNPGYSEEPMARSGCVSAQASRLWRGHTTK